MGFRNATSPLDNLLRAGRRRWLFRRAVEGAAAGAIAGCAAAVLAVAALWWRAESSFNAVAMLIGVGAACGIACSLYWIPSRLHVAHKLDHDNKLHDLLSTAVTLSNGRGDVADDAMRSEIIRQADSAAAAVPVSQLRFARWSSRAYSAGAVMIGLTLTMAAIASNHVERRAERADADIAAAEASRHLVKAEEALSRSTRNRASESARARAAGDSSRIVSNDDPMAGASRNAEGAPIAGNRTGDGNAFAATDVRERTGIPRSAPSSVAESAGAPSAGGGRASSGDVRDRPTSGPGHASAAKLEAQSDPSLRAQSRERAMRLLQSGAVPDAYRDVVREYFLRD